VKSCASAGLDAGVDAQLTDDQLDDQSRVAHLRQIDEAHSPRARAASPSDLGREPCLADASRSEQRHQPL
jgi:hypothetical protein